MSAIFSHFVWGVLKFFIQGRREWDRENMRLLFEFLVVYLILTSQKNPAAEGGATGLSGGGTGVTPP